MNTVRNLNIPKKFVHEKRLYMYVVFFGGYGIYGEKQKTVDLNCRLHYLF